MTAKKKKNPNAVAMGKARWKGTTAAERKAQMADLGRKSGAARQRKTQKNPLDESNERSLE